MSQNQIRSINNNSKIIKENNVNVQQEGIANPKSEVSWNIL